MISHAVADAGALTYTVLLTDQCDCDSESERSSHYECVAKYSVAFEPCANSSSTLPAM